MKSIYLASLIISSTQAELEYGQKIWQGEVKNNLLGQYQLDGEKYYLHNNLAGEIASEILPYTYDSFPSIVTFDTGTDIESIITEIERLYDTYDYEILQINLKSILPFEIDEHELFFTYIQTSKEEFLAFIQEQINSHIIHTGLNFDTLYTKQDSPYYNPHLTTFHIDQYTKLLPNMIDIAQAVNNRMITLEVEYETKARKDAMLLIMLQYKRAIQEYAIQQHRSFMMNLEATLTDKIFYSYNQHDSMAMLAKEFNWNFALDKFQDKANYKHNR